MHARTHARTKDGLDQASIPTLSSFAHLKKDFSFHGTRVAEQTRVNREKNTQEHATMHKPGNT